MADGTREASDFIDQYLVDSVLRLKHGWLWEKWDWGICRQVDAANRMAQMQMPAGTLDWVKYGKGVARVDDGTGIGRYPVYRF